MYNFTYNYHVFTKQCFAVCDWSKSNFPNFCNKFLTFYRIQIDFSIFFFLETAVIYIFLPVISNQQTYGKNSESKVSLYLSLGDDIKI